MQMDSSELSAYIYGCNRREYRWIDIMRTMIAWVVNPHIKDKQTPLDIYPLPGDKGGRNAFISKKKIVESMTDEEYEAWLQS